MIVKIILADTGTQDPFGKTNLLGAGWAVTQLGPHGQTPDQAVAVFIEAPWDRCNRPMQFRMELLNQDGDAVELPTGPPPAPTAPLVIDASITVTPPPTSPNGTPGTAAFFANLVGGLPLAAGQRYTWRVTLDDETEDGWQAGFFVARQQQPARFGPAAPGPIGRD